MHTHTALRGLFVLAMMTLLVGFAAHAATADELCDGYEDAPFCQGESDQDHDYNAPSTDDCVTDWNRAECEVQCYDTDGNAIECPDYVTDPNAPNPHDEGGGDEVGAASASHEDDEVQVLATSITAPEQASHVASATETLPNTGVGTVLLALLGLASVASGAWLVRR
jgi:LPXTG-motif cell wall-anchored protein